VISLQEALEVGARRICCDCVGESFLSKEIANEGDLDDCSYCGLKKKTITIENLAGRVKNVLNEHFDRTSTEPEGYEVFLQKEGTWDRRGNPIVEVIAEIALIDEKPAIDVQEFLDDDAFDFDLAAIGEESPYDSEAHYEMKGPDDSELQIRWAEFESGIKTKSRFFSKSAQSTLNSIFGAVATLRTSDGRPVVVNAGPNENLNAIHRARVFYSNADLEKALARPDLELGPPPFKFAKTGRMNPEGISVFYGATGEEVAIAEVRPAVGSRVVVARFKFLNQMRLLDVDALRDVLIQGSIFDPFHLGRLQHAKFLERLSARISRPIMPTDESFDYLVTQAISEYLSELVDPPFDGVIFRSAQFSNPHGKQNVVLFHHAARVKLLDISNVKNISANSGQLSDDEGDIYYSVWENKPEKRTGDDEDENETDPSYFMPSKSLFADVVDDLREVTLEVDIKDVKVHHIEAVNFRTKSFLVDRHQGDLDNLPF
jgi:hypothetical protein